LKMDAPHLTTVKELRPGLKGLTMILITLEIGKPSTTKDGHEVRSIRVADRTGSVNMSIWDEPGTLIQPGDIVSVHKAYASLFKNNLTLYIGKGGEIYKVGDFCLHFTETPNMSEENFSNPAAVSSGADGSGGAGQSSGGGRDRASSASEGKGATGGGTSGGGQGGAGGGMRSGGGDRDRTGAGFPGNVDGVNRIPVGIKYGGAGKSNNYNNNHHQNNNGGSHNHLDQVIPQNGIKVHRK